MKNSFILVAVLMLISCLAPEAAAKQRLWAWVASDRVIATPVMADFDSDGDPDLAIVSENGTVAVLDGKTGQLLKNSHGREWVYPIGKKVLSSPAAGDLDGDGGPDLVICDRDGTLWALNGRTASKIWSWQARKSQSPFGVAASPVVADLENDGLVEVVSMSNDGRLHMLRGANALHVWARRVDNWDSSPVLTDMNGDGYLDIIVGTGDSSHRVLALKGSTGDLIWDFSTGSAVHGPVACGRLTDKPSMDVVCGGQDRRVHAINGLAGTMLWSRNTTDLINGAPVLVDIDADGIEDVLVCTMDSKVIAYSGTDGTMLWKTSLWGSLTGSPSAVDLNTDGIPDMAIGSSNGMVYLLDGRTGKRIESYRSMAGIIASPLFGDLNGDGFLDMVVAGKDRKVKAFSLNTKIKPYSICWGGLGGDNLRQSSMHRIKQWQKKAAVRIVAKHKSEKVSGKPENSGIPAPKDVETDLPLKETRIQSLWDMFILKKNDPDKGLAILRQILKIDPRNSEARAKMTAMGEKPPPLPLKDEELLKNLPPLNLDNSAGADQVQALLKRAEDREKAGLLVEAQVDLMEILSRYAPGNRIALERLARLRVRISQAQAWEQSNPGFMKKLQPW